MATVIRRSLPTARETGRAHEALPEVAASVLTVLLVAGLLFFFFVLPVRVERALNRTRHVPPYRATADARDLHRTLTIADLHADSLLFACDLLERSTRGHVDLSRLIEGHVALQIFSAVTKSPRGLNVEQNAGDTDDIIQIALAGRWPVRTWFSLLESGSCWTTCRTIRRSIERAAR